MTVQGSFAAVARADRRGALVTVVRGPNAGARLLVHADGSLEGGTLGDLELDARAVAGAQELIWAERSELRGELFIDVTAPAPRLLIFGAVAYANHLAHLARVTGWRAYVIDPRARFAARARFPDAIEVVTSWPAPALEQLGAIDRATYIAVLSNDPKIDDEILQLALDADPAYIGAMGSRHAQLERRERLLAAGVGEPELARITAPVGLDLGALSAEETALSIMAEIVAVHHGRDGRRLSALGTGDGALKARPAAPVLDTIRSSEYCRAAEAETASSLVTVPSRAVGAGTEVDQMTRRAEVRPHDRDGVSCSR